MTQEFFLALCGLAGVIFHCLLKLNDLLKDARTANLDFNWWKDYVQKDAVPIMLSVLSVVIWMLVYKEVQNNYKAVSDWTRLSFVGMGLMGSYVIQKVMSGAKKKIRTFVDAKTNVSDAVTGPASSPLDIVEKGSSATGADIQLTPKK